MLLGVVLVGRALEERAKLQASADMAALQVGGWRVIGKEVFREGWCLPTRRLWPRCRLLLAWRHCRRASFLAVCLPGGTICSAVLRQHHLPGLHEAAACMASLGSMLARTSPSPLGIAFSCLFPPPLAGPAAAQGAPAAGRRQLAGGALRVCGRGRCADGAARRPGPRGWGTWATALAYPPARLPACLPELGVQLRQSGCSVPGPRALVVGLSMRACILPHLLQVVVGGRSTVDESALTGEPLPVTKTQGERQTGGSTATCLHRRSAAAQLPPICTPLATHPTAPEPS
jgi:hypothetical protein